jgi:branched-chain amino acid transport system permease protein
MTRAFLPMLFRQLMNGSDADALASGVSSISIYLLMAIALLVRPRRMLAGTP